MKKTIFLVVLAMVILCSNACAQTECSTPSKKAMSYGAARQMMRDLQAVDPDKRWVTFEDDCSEVCGNKDVVVWGYMLALGGKHFYGLSVCSNLEKDERFNHRNERVDLTNEYKFMWAKD